MKRTDTRALFTRACEYTTVINIFACIAVDIFYHAPNKSSDRIVAIEIGYFG